MEMQEKNVRTGTGTSRVRETAMGTGGERAQGENAFFLVLAGWYRFALESASARSWEPEVRIRGGTAPCTPEQ
jgi:hypothetical protein